MWRMNAGRLFVVQLLLVRHVEREVVAPISVFQHLIATVNTLVQHNTPAVRLCMRMAGLFDARDDLLIGLLQADLPSDRAELFRSLPFESVADQPRFRDANGLLYLLRHLHRPGANRATQAVLLYLIVNVFLPIDENRRLIAKIIDDPTVMAALTSASAHSVADGDADADDTPYTPQAPRLPSTGSTVSDAVATTRTASAGISISPHGSQSSMSAPNDGPGNALGDAGAGAGDAEAADEGSGEREADVTDEALMTLDPSVAPPHLERVIEFVRWYWSSDPDVVLRRTAVEQRIERLCLPLVSVARRTQEKVQRRALGNDPFGKQLDLTRGLARLARCG